MTNTTEATITTHDEWVAYFSGPGLSEFAREQIASGIYGEKALAQVSKDDSDGYYAREFVASEGQYYARLEAKSDAELVAELAENEAAYRAHSRYDDPEWEPDYDDEYYRRQDLIEALLAHRATRARYIGLAPLTHSPFAGLAVAA